METLKRCLITKYDKSIQEPPFLTIPLDTIDVYEPSNDKLGEEFANRLRIECQLKGYIFKFYSSSIDKNYDYEVVVYGEIE